MLDGEVDGRACRGRVLVRRTTEAGIVMAESDATSFSRWEPCRDEARPPAFHGRFFVLAEEVLSADRRFVEHTAVVGSNPRRLLHQRRDDLVARDVASRKARFATAEVGVALKRDSSSHGQLGVTSSPSSSNSSTIAQRLDAKPIAQRLRRLAKRDPIAASRTISIGIGFVRRRPTANLEEHAGSGPPRRRWARAFFSSRSCRTTFSQQAHGACSVCHSVTWPGSMLVRFRVLAHGPARLRKLLGG